MGVSAMKAETIKGYTDKSTVSLYIVLQWKYYINNFQISDLPKVSGIMSHT